MIKRTSKLALAFAAMLSLAVIGCSDDDDNNPMANGAAGPTLDIVETAAADGRFTTLLAAVEAAGLTDALKGDGPLTVFAPTDDAFAALPAGTVDALLNDIDALTAILTYHVVPGAVRAADVVQLTSAATLNGAEATVTVTSEGAVKIDNANVIITDIETTNGIIHVIDAVIVPTDGTSSRGDAPSPASAFFWGYRIGGGWISQAIVEGRLNWLTRYLSIYTVARLADLETLTTAVKAADLKQTLQRSGPFTVFAPTEDAFAALPAGTIPALLNDPATLANILLYHVTPGRVFAADVVTLTEATMANGGTVAISVDGGAVKVNDANVIAVNILARNGVIHVIDGVLLP